MSRFRLLIHCVLILFFSSCSPSSKPLIAEKGVLDLRNYDFEKGGKVKLNGEWELYWEEFLLKQEEFQQKKPIFVKIPKVWSKHEIEREKNNFSDYATFRLKILLPPNVTELWVRSRAIFNSNNIYANGLLISSSGKVGKTREETINSLTPSIGIIHKPTETLELVIHVANHEDYETGIKAPILLGSKKSILRDFYFNLLSDIFLIGSLFTMGAYYLVLYFLRRRELQILLFFLICFILILRTAALNEKTLLVVFPNLSLAIHKKINYFSHFVALTLVFHFVLNFIESQNFKKWIWFNHIFSGFCILAVITLPLFYASQLLNVLKIQSLLTLFFLIYQFLKHRQETKRYGNFLLLGVSILTVTVINDILVHQQIFQGSYLVGYGILSFMFSLSYSLGIKLMDAFNRAENLSETLQKTNESIIKFVPLEFFRLLGKTSIQEIKLGNQAQKELCILFSDIRSFTSLAEQMSPEECFEFLNSYYERIGPIIRKHNGFIDKYVGDGIMALFPETVENAIEAAIEMQEEVKKLNEERKLQSKQEIKIGIGIHKGPSIIGIIGEKQRTDSTVIADAVNLASRIESLTKDFNTGILLSFETFLELENPFVYHFRFLGKVQVKGKSKSVGIVEILNFYPEEGIEKIVQTKGVFEEALGFYNSGQFSLAKEKFEKVLQQNPSDTACLYYLDRLSHKSIELENF